MSTLVLLASGALGALGGAAEAGASKLRYTLTATYSSVYDSHDRAELCGWAVPPGYHPPEVDKVYVCSLDWHTDHRSTSYVARSTKPFVFSRSAFRPPYFAFTTPMTGTFKEVLGSSHWSNWYLGGEGYHLCTGYGGGSASGTLKGTMSMAGYTKARPKVKMRAVGGPFGSVTSVTTCEGTGTTENTDPHGGIKDEAWLKFVDLRKPFGHAFTVTDTRVDTGLLRPPRERTTTRWRLEFVPVEEKPRERRRWQIEVRGQDRWSWGVYTGLRAGVDVDWAHRTTLEVQDGKLVSATGKVHILKVAPFSEPPDAFTVTHKATTRPAYRVTKAVKRGDRVELGLLKVGSSEYRVDFTSTVAGPQVLEQLRRIGVADPDRTYDTMVARGPVTDSAASLVPNSPRVVVRLRPGVYSRETDGYARQLPCLTFGAKQEDCFLRRGGEIITVTRLL